MKVSFKIEGKGKTLVLLHGWSIGMRKEKYQPLVEFLAKKYKVVSLDFPGFGGTKAPNKPWCVEDYANWLANFLKEEKINPDILIGHSFGGRVVIKGVANGSINPEKIVLLASAGIERKSLRVKCLFFLAKLVPTVIKSQVNFGSKDFRETSGVMRETMKLVVSENLENDMLRIKKSCLLIWGANDQTTPLWQGKLTNELIKGSELKIIEGANHGLAYKEAEKVSQLIIDWVK